MTLPLVISVVSKKANTGKTTLITHLLPILRANGYRVMTMKYSCYDFVADRKGTDSDRHFSSGAERTMIVGPSKCVTFERVREHLGIDHWIDRCSDFDLILAEGFRDSPYPTIEVVRSEMGESTFANGNDLIAVVTDMKGKKFCVPSFDLNEYDAIAELIISYWLRHSAQYPSQSAMHSRKFHKQRVVNSCD